MATILDGQTYNVNFKAASTVTDETNTPNLLTLKGYDVRKIDFTKNAGYSIIISGSVTNSTGYTSINPATPTNLYWIGSTYSTNEWHNSINWNTNANGTARHKIQLRGTDLKMRINFQDESYYKLVDDYKSTSNNLYFIGTSDIDASNITINLANIIAATAAPIASGK